MIWDELLFLTVTEEVGAACCEGWIEGIVAKEKRIHIKIQKQLKNMGKWGNGFMGNIGKWIHIEGTRVL